MMKEGFGRDRDGVYRSSIILNGLIIIERLFYKIPPDLPFPTGPAFRGIWQMVRLAHPPELAEGEGQGEIFQCLCQFNYETVDMSSR